MKPKRLCAKNLLGEDGMREYSVFKCHHGCGDSVYVLSDNIRMHKKQAITDHLAICTAISDEERPVKVKRGGVAISTLSGVANAQNVVLKDANDRLHEENDRLKSENAELERSLDYAHSALKLHRKSLLYALNSVDDIQETIGCSEQSASDLGDL